MKQISLFSFFLLFSLIIINAQEYSCITPPPNMISWWTGDIDSSDFIGNYNAILVNGISIEVGKVDSAFSFDGIDDYIEVPDTSAFDISSGEFSIDFWVKPNNCTVISSDAIPLITKESTTQFDAYTIGIALGEEFIFAASNDEITYQTITRGGSCIPGEWHLIAATQKDSIAKLYVNGVLVDVDSSATIPINTNLPLFFGYREDVSGNPGSQTRYFDGKLDEIEFFNRALTETEILNIYNADSAGKCKCECMPIPYCSVVIYDTIAVPDTIKVFDTIKVYENIAVTDTLIIDLATNLNYTNESGIIKVYPNPATTLLNILIQEDSEHFNKIQLLNNSGKLIREKYCDQSQFNMDISDLSPGLYLIRVLDNSESIVDTKKLILE